MADIDTPFLSVAIPTRNRHVFLEKTARSVLAQLDAQTLLFIVDNASTDTTAETVAALAAADSRVRYIHETQLGSSAARNAALHAAQSEWLLFVDDDELVDEGWFNAYREFLLNPPERLACVGGPAIADFEVPPPSWINPSFYTFTQGDTTRKLEEGGGIGAGNVAYHRGRVLKVGGFNTSLGRIGGFLGAHEETELSERLRAAGWEIWWLPTARILHFMPAERTTLRHLLQSEFGSGRSLGVIALKTNQTLTFRAGRILSASARVVLYTLGALLLLPASRQRRSVRLLLRAARAAGVMYQFTQQT